MQAQETFQVGGIAPDVTYARVAALNGLRDILGSEPEELWEMVQAAYGRVTLGTGEDDIEDAEPEIGCRYSITFARVREEVEA